jgi:hypothetical protein
LGCGSPVRTELKDESKDTQNKRVKISKNKNKRYATDMRRDK